MKRSLLSLTLIMAVVICQAQQYSHVTLPWGFWSQVSIDNTSRELLREQEVLKEHHVKSREKNRFVKGIPVSTIEYFDLDGRITKSIHKSKKYGTTTAEYSYDVNGNLIKKEIVNDKNQSSVVTYKYDAENRLIERMSMNRKQHYSGAKIAYNEQGKIVYRKIYEKDDQVPAKALEYTYYENGDPETTTYFEKGKLKYCWKYDCKPEGELIAIKNKGETTICISEEIDEFGNRVVWERKFNEDGVLTKYKNVYRLDSLILLWQQYANSDHLVFQMDYAYDDNNVLIENKMTGYSTEGVSRTLSKTIYSKKKGRFTTFYNKKGEVQYTSQVHVGAAGLLTKSQKIDGRNSYTYLYNYTNGLKTAEIRIYKHGTYINEYVYDFYE